MKTFTERGRIKLGFSDKTLKELTDIKDSVLLGMTGNDFFPETKEAVGQLQTEGDEFDSLNTQIAARNFTLVARRDAVQLKVIASLEKIGSAVVTKSDGNFEMLASSGYELYKTRTPAPKITKPQNLKVVVGKQSGQLGSSVSAVPGAAGYRFEWRQTESGPQGAWAGLQIGYVSYTITGLTPGVSYETRVGAVDKNANVLYTDPVTRFVI